MSSPSQAYRLMKIVATTLLGILIATLFYYSTLHDRLFQRKAREQVTAAGPLEARPKAMDFEFIENRTGRKMRPSYFAGKIVHVNFWASWCLPCQQELPYLAQLQKDNADKYVVILINLDTEKDGQLAVQEMQARLAPELLSVYENTATLKTFFNIEALPFHYVIDKSGRTATAFYAQIDKQGEEFKALLLQLTNESSSAP